jgi:hypothetical protein
MSRSFGLIDRLKIRFILFIRRINLASIERWSLSTFRKRRALPVGKLDVTTAAEHYGSPILPPALKVPRSIPVAARLSAGYVFPYYILSGIVFKLYKALPLSKSVEYDPGAWFNQTFPPHQEGWDDILSDEGFTAMRLQGPNPFLLQATDDGAFEVDYAPITKGAYEDTRCRFVSDGDGLVPESITIGDETFARSADGWDEAKAYANAIDARFVIFVRHLMHTHLITGQSYAISLFELPSGHPVRDFIDFFTYSTLVINDFAFRLLVTPASYFLESGFVSGGAVGQMFENFVDLYDLDQLIPPKDIAARGIDAVPDHPYVVESTAIWAVMETFVREYLAERYTGDDAVQSDEAVLGWYRSLCELLPSEDADAKPLTFDRLVEVLAALVYLQVSHEIAGDFAPYFTQTDETHKQIIHIDQCAPGKGGPVRAHGAFLMDQGAWAGRWENYGNILLDLDPADHIENPTLRAAVESLQSRLRDLDEEVTARNAERARPFLRMQPRLWQASISY